MSALGGGRVGTYEITCCGKRQTWRGTPGPWGVNMKCDVCESHVTARRVD